MDPVRDEPTVSVVMPANASAAVEFIWNSAPAATVSDGTFGNCRAPSKTAVPPLNESVPDIGWLKYFVFVNVSVCAPFGAHTIESES